MPLRRGRQYPREVAVTEYSFAFQGSGEIMAWSRIFDNQEILVVINTHGNEGRGGRVVIDKRLSAEGMQLIANTDPNAPAEVNPGAKLDCISNGAWNFVEIFRDGWLLGPSEVMVLANRSAFTGANLSEKWNG